MKMYDHGGNVRRQDGEHLYHYNDGSLMSRYFIYNGKLHGEYKIWNLHGDITGHHIYINGEEHPHFEMNDQEKLLFQIKYPGFRFIEN